MEKIKIGMIIGGLLMMAACSSTQSLQEYYVDNSENPNFLTVDLPVSLLNLEETELEPEEKTALESLDKLNILAFKKSEQNGTVYEVERKKVKDILKNSKFNELMRMNTEYGKAIIKYMGDDDAVDELIIYGDSKEKGFILVRVLGNDMNPAHMMQFIKAVEKSDYDGKGLEKLQEFLKS